MDPYEDIIRVCIISPSQEEVLRSHCPGKSIDSLPTPFSQKDQVFGTQIAQIPTGILLSSPFLKPSDEEQEEGYEPEDEAARTFQESTSAVKTPEKSSPGVRRMSSVKNLGVLNEDPGVGQGDHGSVTSAGCKRKSTVEMQSECSPGSAAKKSRFVDLSLQKLKTDSSSVVNVSVDVGLSKGKSSGEKDKGFFDRLKARLFSRSLGLGSPERAKGEHLATLRITADVSAASTVLTSPSLEGEAHRNDIAENVKRSPASEEKIPHSNDNAKRSPASKEKIPPCYDNSENVKRSPASKEKVPHCNDNTENLKYPASKEKIPCCNDNTENVKSPDSKKKIPRFNDNTENVKRSPASNEKIPRGNYGQKNVYRSPALKEGVPCCYDNTDNVKQSPGLKEKIPGFNDNTENVKLPPASEENFPAAEKDERFSKGKGISPWKSTVLELPQQIGNVWDADSGASMEEDLGLWKLKVESVRKSLASALFERVSNVGGADSSGCMEKDRGLWKSKEDIERISNVGVADAAVSMEKDPGLWKLKEESVRSSSASELPERKSNVGSADATVSMEKDQGLWKLKEESVRSSSASELPERKSNVGSADAAVSMEKDQGLWKLKEESVRKSFASELLERISNVLGADAAVLEAKSPAQGNVGMSELKVEHSRRPSGSELVVRNNSIRDVNSSVSKGVKDDLLLLTLKRESSIQFAAKHSQKSQQSGEVTTPEDLLGDDKSPYSRQNAIAQEGKSQADNNIGFSKSSGRNPVKLLAKDQHSKSADGIPNSLNDLPTKQANREQELENLTSDIHYVGRNPSSNNTGLVADMFLNIRYNKSTDAQECPSKQSIKEALGIDKTSSKDVCMQQKRKLPPSIQGPSDENKECSLGGGGPISKAKGSDDTCLMHFLDVTMALQKESDRGIEHENILDVAKRAGYVFPKPRWWRPQGYSN